MADLTTLAKVKEWIPNYSGTADDALLTRLISAASDYIETYLNRGLLSQAYTTQRDGNGGTRLMFLNYPVTAVSLVKVDQQTIPASVNGSPGYVFDSTSVALIGYTFTRGYQNVSLNYTAGYATIPNEIEQACIELAALRYRDRERIGIQSKGMSGETITFSKKDFTDGIEQTLRQYRRVMLP